MKRDLQYRLFTATSGFVFTTLALVQTTFAQPAAALTDVRLGKKVKYQTQQAGVQDIVQNLVEQPAQPPDPPVRLAALHPDQMPELNGRALCVYNFTSW